MIYQTHTTSKILHSDASQKLTQELEFKFWHYIIIKSSIQALSFLREHSSYENDLISNTRCTMFIIDKSFLIERVLDAEIK